MVNLKCGSVVFVLFSTTIGPTLAVAKVVPYTSDVFGILIAMATALFVMGRRAEQNELSLWQAICEIALSGIAGFISHGVAVEAGASLRGAWISCACTGYVGSKAIERFIQRGHKNDSNSHNNE